ncbi:M18 family aminopeptidase [Pseudoflavonifractor sp. SW1122]|uniref:M18 family aminopeptidase n=1 Tax=Pseudoflavonifractor sp. SW1122 TaxID=2530044 RepID=UPI00143BE87F|nr:M18 family aminopeptidase [Pseudoflavonifractor sp. SW1122]NJE74221.1 M18 family aminopeptidase [Pseudoflavonifractor sp. SW1122]
MYQETSREVLNFIEHSPSCFHAVEQLSQMLDQAGYQRLKECNGWTLEQGGKYYVTRNGSSIIAFHVGQQLDNYHFQITASHSDSPSYKVKEKAELKGKGGYLQLNTEGYGGMICSSWLDRPLSLAGRVLVRQGNVVETRLLNIDRDLLLIPNVAIHMNRDVNSGMKYNQQVDMLPLFSAGECGENSYYELIAQELGMKPEDVVGCDLYLYPRVAPSLWGAKEEFISSPRLDDLQCAYTSMKALVDSHNPHGVNVCCCFDNEEVGSGTKQGALSTFLRDVLQRVHAALGHAPEDYFRAVAKSFMVSCDNAHAVHPNHPEKTDGENCVYMNKGIVVKFSANQKYTTDGISAAIFMQLCKDAQVPVQTFANRSDMAGGSTLGNLSTQQVSLHTVDVGLPQLAMHSTYETAGVKDSAYMVQALTAFYNTDLDITDSDRFVLG